MVVGGGAAHIQSSNKAASSGSPRSWAVRQVAITLVADHDQSHEDYYADERASGESDCEDRGDDHSGLQYPEPPQASLAATGD
jgi:hypothetical protein